MRNLASLMQCSLALLILPYALNAAPSIAQDYNLSDYAIRQRRDAEEMVKPQSTTTAPKVDQIKIEQQSEAASIISTTTSPNPSEEATIEIENPNASSSLNKTSVLVLIRDALKKVTTVLPTEQVATNALQYFQLFEHFIQQTIERVIDDYDEDDDETTTIKIDEETTEKVEMNENNEINLDSKDNIIPSSNEIKKGSTNQIPKESSLTVQPVMETTIPSL